MACGVCLGILLVCLIQAEHVSCLWYSRANGQDSNRYVGFSQHDGRLQRIDGSSPHNQLRQAYFSPRSLNAQSATNVHGQGPFFARRALTSPWPSHKPLKFGSTLLKPNQQIVNEKAAFPKVLKKEPFQLAYGASGSYLSKFGDKKAIKPSTQRADQRPSTVQGSRDSYSFRPPPAMMPKRPTKPGPVPLGRGIASASSPARRASARKSYVPLASNSFPKVVSRPLHQGQSSKAVQQSFSPNRGKTPASKKRFAPTVLINIPDRFGGFAITRLKAPKSPRKKVVQKPLLKAVTLPAQMPTLRPHVQRGQPDTEWKKLRLLQRF